MVLWLRLHASTAGELQEVWVWYLVRELGLYMLPSVAKIFLKKQEKALIISLMSNR